MTTCSAVPERGEILQSLIKLPSTTPFVCPTAFLHGIGLVALFYGRNAVFKDRE